nr:hypothetical protein [Tanacetum cinerariifolium]
NNNINHKVNTVRSKNVNTARPKAVVNVVNGNIVNTVKASACWVWKSKIKVIDYVSKHNSASITLKKLIMLMHKADPNYEEIDGEYVSFGGNPKGGKITGKGAIRTGSGPDWLYDIDALTRTMNYEPIVIGTQSNGFAEPKKVIHALKDLSWIETMQEELLQFKLQEVWTLVDLPSGKRAIGTKWVFQNKKDERGFEDPNFPDNVYKVEKSLYGLQQAPRACSTKKELCIAFKKMMHEKFQMSPMRELTFFLGLQVKQKQDRIFISQDKFVIGILKKYSVCMCKIQLNPKVSYLHAVKRILKYLKGQPKFGRWYPKDLPFDLVAYTDSDYAGANLDRKSKTRGC